MKAEETFSLPFFLPSPGFCVANAQSIPNESECSVDSSKLFLKFLCAIEERAKARREWKSLDSIFMSLRVSKECRSLQSSSSSLPHGMAFWLVLVDALFILLFFHVPCLLEPAWSWLNINIYKSNIKTKQTHSYLGKELLDFSWQRCGLALST